MQICLKIGLKMDKNNLFSLVLLSVLMFSFSRLSRCDVYLHNGRGSNNRLNENTRARKNAQRLFDSQNNARGGYNEGNVYYLVGSRLQIEWTAQHSCADQNNHCTMILQYMCSKTLRDGASTGTIPKRNSQCMNKSCSTDIRYGMHEDNEYYLRCEARQRNKGLFIADQKLRGRDRAINTRQNPKGTRYGYECPEERDYYPYWYSSPWKDIAVLTNNVKNCKYFQRESQNVKSRWECRVPVTILEKLINQRKYLPTNRSTCEIPSLNGTWTEIRSHAIPPPECREPEWTRDNHLGNTVNGYTPSYNWTIPGGENENHLCTLRIRYNISTSDYNGWNTYSDGPKANDFGSKFGFSSAEAAKKRGYKLKLNPTVQLASDAGGRKLELELAVDTSQFGRVFQDRTHGFFIKPKPSSVKGALHNVNVRGKRGNIVQVYPSVEYDFTPNTLRISPGDNVHFQWTGSNNNNPNNDGQGRAGSDRNNVLLQASAAYSGLSPSYDVPVFGRWGRSYPQFALSTGNTSFLNFSATDLEKLAFSGVSMGDVEELDDAGTYFDLGPRKVTMAGVAHFMCTRNNNFSNRSQKGRIICDPYKITYFSVGAVGGSFRSPGGSAVIRVGENVFPKLVSFQIEEWSYEAGDKLLLEKHVNPPSGDGYASNFVKIVFSETFSGKINILLKVEDTASDLSVYRGNPDTLGSWERLEEKKENSTHISFLTDKDGIFVARYHDSSKIPLIIGLSVLGVFVIVAVGVAIHLHRNRQLLNRFFNNFTQKV